jgi:hypothetical protein
VVEGRGCAEGGNGYGVGSAQALVFACVLGREGRAPAAGCEKGEAYAGIIYGRGLGWSGWGWVGVLHDMPSVVRWGDESCTCERDWCADATDVSRLSHPFGDGRPKGAGPLV